MDPWRSPLLDLPGAVPAEPPDAGVAAHYGDPLREQRVAEAGCVVVDRSHRGVLRVSGPDRLSWLHSITSQHLSHLPPGRGTESLVLSPHGHVEHHLLLADDGTTTWADVEPGTAPALLAFLESMRFLLQVEPSDVSAGTAVLSLVGPRSESVAAAAGMAAGAAAYDVTSTADGVLTRRMPWPLEDAVDLLVARDLLEETVARLREAGAEPAGSWAFEALRVVTGRPRLGNESDHRTIPHEVGWLHTAVHLDKGCYRGQETVARVHNLGRPPRRLVFLHLDGSVDRLPPHGAPVTWLDAQVGFVTSAARHHELGPVALALVRRNTPDDAALLAGDVPAAVAAPPAPAAVG